MILADNMLYPIHTIKNIAIDRDKLTMTIYFVAEMKMYPITLTFKSLNELDEKVKEFNGTRKKSLLG